MKPRVIGLLPLMKSVEEAIAVCRERNDNFFLSAYMIQAWLGELTCSVVAEYAEKKSASRRRLQEGLARKLFAGTFGQAGDKEFPHVFHALARFAEFDDPQSKRLRDVFWVMSIETPAGTWPQPSNPPSARERLAGSSFMRRLTDRLCEWVEAVVHAEIHRFSHLAPVAFDPDPDKRELAVLGVQQRHFPGMSESSKAWWEWHHAEAAERFKDSPKWPTLGAAMANDQTRHHSYPGLDEFVIRIWPLVRRHQWTYRDLIKVIHALAPEPVGYPCKCEQDLAAYCANVLGLRKGEAGKSCAQLPPGFDLAQALCGGRGGQDAS